VLYQLRLQYILRDHILFYIDLRYINAPGNTYKYVHSCDSTPTLFVRNDILTPSYCPFPLLLIELSGWVWTNDRVWV